MEDKLPSGRGGMASPLSTAFDCARCGCPFTMPWKKLRDLWSRELLFAKSQKQRLSQGRRYAPADIQDLGV